jgi:DNA-binding response OmpR family regulator/GGDEF domain-containing protein
MSQLPVTRVALLVASDEWTRRQLEPALSQNRCQLRSLQAALDAYRELTTQAPDLLLLDLSREREAALALLRRVRGAEQTAELPVVVVTGADHEADLREALDAGADAYLTRPLQPTLASACIRGLLGRTTSPRRARARARGVPDEVRRTARDQPRVLDGEHGELDAFGRSSTSPRLSVAPHTGEVLSTEWALFKAVQSAISACLHTSRPLAALMMEVTALDALPERDQAAFLTAVWERATAALEPPDPLRHFEGLAFFTVLAGMDEPSVVGAVKRVMCALQQFPIRVEDRPVRATAAFGVALLEPPFLYSPFKVIDCSRQALQQAKRVAGCGWWVEHPQRVVSTS